MQDDAEQRRVYGRQPPTQGAGRGTLRDAIAQEEVLLATLEAQQAESRHRLAALHAELAALDAEPEIRVRLSLALEGPIPQTPADKVRLFRSLFRGERMSFRLDSRVERPGEMDTPRRAETNSSRILG